MYVFNRVFNTVAEDKTPQEVWSSMKPSVQHFRVLRCDAYAHVPDEQ